MIITNPIHEPLQPYNTCQSFENLPRTPLSVPVVTLSNDCKAICFYSTSSFGMGLYIVDERKKPTNYKM